MMWRTLVTLEGARGRLRGEAGDPGQGRVEARTFASGLAHLRDQLAGSGGGRCQHRPLAFTKSVGAATPQLAQAACAGEVLRSVTFEFARFASGGAEEVVFVVRLGEVTISGHALAMAEGSQASGGAPLVETVELTYRRIEWEHRLAKTMAADSWA